MEEIGLESHGSRCVIEAPDTIVEKILSDPFTQHFIPDVRMTDGSGAHVSVRWDESLTEPTALSYPTCSVRGLDARDIVGVAEYLLERSRQERAGLYALSSATCVRETGAVTFFGGATHLGKTTCMHALTQAGFQFYADEKTLLNLEEAAVDGGSRSFAVRKEVLKERIGSREEFVKMTHEAAPSRSSLFVYPHLDHGLENPITYQFAPEDFFWHLHRELSVVIRGATRLTAGFTRPMASIDTPELSEERTRRELAFCKQVPCIYFQGSAAQLLPLVEQCLRR